VGKVLFAVFLVLLGSFFMWIAIFGKKKEINDLSPGIPTDIIEFFMWIIYKLFPNFIRRIFIFLLGFGLIGVSIYLLLY
jgi:hypothetical protein